jgi:hypothetical protein
VLAGQLSETEAAGAGARAVELLPKAPNLRAREPLAHAVAALAGRLGDKKEARRLCAAASRHVLEAMEQWIDEWGRDGFLDLAYALVALSKGLGEKEAAGFCAAAARRILKTQNLRTLSEDGAAMNREFFALQALASSLGEKEAVEVANLMRQLAVDSTAAEPDGNRRRMCIRVEMAETMMVLSGRMGEKEAWEFAGRSLEDMLLMAYVPPSQA